MIAIKLIAIFTLLLLVIKPKLIRRLASIKNIEKGDDHLINVFEEITNYFISIKNFSNMTVPLYINSHRVEFSCKLIREGYLENYSMDALAEKSGFSSQKNFNRVFKLIMSLTPTEYKKLCEK